MSAQDIFGQRQERGRAVDEEVPDGGRVREVDPGAHAVQSDLHALGVAHALVRVHVQDFTLQTWARQASRGERVRRLAVVDPYVLIRKGERDAADAVVRPVADVLEDLVAVLPEAVA